MTVDKHAHHWKQMVQRDLKTARSLFDIKRYDACLFFCHLTIEKFLKGLIVYHTRQDAPFIHDLERLFLLTNLTTTIDTIDDLKAISAFNIAGRYSDYKFSFHKKCTKVYSQQYLSKTEKLVLWLKKQYPKV